ncbi:hypothetical protein PF002_g30308 [Phytophthora fragariae]|nr:hypothetical protein PF003_g29692 [Phytophthora fragariae]KAE8942287.1 hypothetical protein PF009_g7948 [Phytophthora fragariae]KAE9061313.1 hypothetical protein PF007_g30300 [Phytophthora fragariae]KAE9067197.1 hypothetical protein PF006_g30047 [Phytophthora fragariae]KAE9169628.1 hypothetical protein PF002_g30308 [Phytophthora fragariae]
MADTVPLTSSFVAQPRYDEENTQLAARPEATEGLFGDDADSDRTENDPYNSGRKSVKRQRSDKYEKMREVLEERSDALLAHVEQLQREEMRERRNQHQDQMALMREFLAAMTKTNRENEK